MSRFGKTCLALFLAINLTGIAVAFFIHANLGSDTVTVFVDGLSRVLNCSLSSASRLYNGVMLGIALIVARKHIGWCTVVYALSVGFLIDWYSELLLPLNIMNSALTIKLLWVLAGQICFGVTYALLIQYRNGMSQVDAVTYYLCDKMKIKFVYMRTIMDLLLLGGGWLMGGVVGIGSVIAMATTGAFIDIALKLMNRKTVSTE